MKKIILSLLVCFLCLSAMAQGVENGHEWVDLGLSVEWATCNIGASTPESYGNYYAWGDISSNGKRFYWTDYRFCTRGTYEDACFSKYNTKPTNGIVDNRTRLELIDDVARQSWGGTWRMPTDAEWTELRTLCTWTWTTQNGIRGCKVTAANGRSIFLPAAGEWLLSSASATGDRGSYWSSSLLIETPFMAWIVYFNSSKAAQSIQDRCVGLPVRPVTDLSSSVNTQKKTGTIKIESNPSGADIYIDGKPIGRTPAIVENLKMGSHTIKLSLESYIDVSGSVKVSSGERAYFFRDLVQQQSNYYGTGTENGYEWVDLGLSVKWATCNVGATSFDDYGFYYAWAETSPKSDYLWSNLMYRLSGNSDSNVAFSKYCTSDEGTVDNKTILDLSDDAARKNWGGTWRMPTYAEWEELMIICKWQWTTQYGNSGYRVISPNGKSIFLPAGGEQWRRSLEEVGSFGMYWSSSLKIDGDIYAWSLYFDSSEVDVSPFQRCLGRSVRPVKE